MTDANDQEYRVDIPSPEGLDAEIVVKAGEGFNPAAFGDVLAGRIEADAKALSDQFEDY